MDWKLILQIAGVVLGLLYLWLEYRADIRLWIVGLVMPLVHGALYYKAGLYADCSMQVYYVLAGLYGWLVWRNAPRKKAKTARNAAAAGPTDQTARSAEPAAARTARNTTAGHSDQTACNAGPEAAQTARSAEPAAVRIGHLLDIQLEVDGADDAVAKLLVHQRFQRGTVDLQHFIETINGRVGRHAAGNAAAQRDGLQQLHRFFIQPQLGRHHARRRFRQRMLPQQGGGDERQAETGALGQRFERQVMADLGGHDGVGERFARGGVVQRVCHVGSFCGLKNGRSPAWRSPRDGWRAARSGGFRRPAPR